MIKYSLRARLHRLASQESINLCCASSARANGPPEDPPAFSNVPEVDQSRIDWEFEPNNIPDAEVDLGTIWAEVFCAHAPIEVEARQRAL